MEPLMTTAPLPEGLGEAAEDFKQGGWIVSMLGGAGMLVRILLSDREPNIVYVVRRVIAGSIVGCLCYFALHGAEMDGLKKSIILTTAGTFSPEVFEYLRRKIRTQIYEKKNKSKRRKTSRRK